MNSNYTKQSRAAFFAFLEQERQEMLAAEMNEADIFRIHFGELDENGNQCKDAYPGDYTVWLSERKHSRTDRKYARGTPQSIDSLKYEGDRFRDDAVADLLLNMEQKADIEALLKTLTPKQRALIQALVFDGVTPAEYALKNKVSKSTISQILGRVKKIL